MRVTVCAMEAEDPKQTLRDRLIQKVIQSGRRLVLRVLGWNPWLMTFFRLVSLLRQ
jgi:hypothetical protein